MPLIDHLTPAARRVVVGLSSLLAAVTLVFAGHILFGLGGAGIDALAEDWLVTALVTGAAAGAVLRVALVREQRLIWAPIAIGLVLYALGTALWSFWLQRLAEPPFPSIADPMWLMIYPLAYTTMVLAIRQRTGRLSRNVWFDGLIALLAVAAVGGQVLTPFINGAEGTATAVVTALAYPVADVVLIAFAAAGCYLCGWRPGWAWLLLGLGALALAAGDLLYVAQVSEADYVTGGPANLLWSLCVLCFAQAAWLPVPTRAAARPDGRVAAAVPTVCGLGAVALLAFDEIFTVNPFSKVMATATVVAALARLLYTAREERLLGESRRQARTDELTGLPNRRALTASLHGALADGDPRLALLFMDLDGFKELNDTLGHETGDHLLTALGHRLSGLLDDHTYLARLGGDEFAVICHEGSRWNPAELADYLLDAVRTPFAVDGLSLQCGASIGIALAPEHGRSAGDLLKRADTAMYQAKAARSGWESYKGTQDSSSASRLALAGQLGAALRNGEILPFYQPQVDAQTGRVLSLEALVRWQHPDQGTLAPGAFLPAAEQTNLMRELTLSVLDQAVRDCVAWRLQDLDVTIAVNLAASNIADESFPDAVAKVIAHHGLDPGALRLEVTESILMVDPERGLALMRRLVAQGIELALDDYGTQHSSLTYLNILPIGELKIDRSFVAQMTACRRTADIVQATLDLADRLGLRSVAEGVEDQPTLALLTEMGCGVIQGYLFARPMPAAEFVPWHADHEQRVKTQLVAQR